VNAALTAQREKVSESVRVLLVEDDGDLRLTIRTTLEERGFVIDEAVHGAEALQRLSVEPTPDLILLDLMMPVMDGWRFLQLWRERDPHRHVPVIALSAVSYRGAPGADATLAKPLDVDVLERIIRQTIQRSRLLG